MGVAIRMAFHAVRKFRNSGVDVIVLNFDRVLVLVTVVAGVGRVRLDMAGGAGNVALVAVSDRKIMLGQFRGQPAGNGMAHRAIGAEQAGVNFGIGMTGVAIRRRPAEVRRRVAARAAHTGMPALQGKGGMRKRLKLAMAGLAVGAEGGHMPIDKRPVDFTVTAFAQ